MELNPIWGLTDTLWYNTALLTIKKNLETKLWELCKNFVRFLQGVVGKLKMSLDFFGQRSKESAVVLSSVVSCQNSCSRWFLQIFHAKILTRCRLEATHETIERLLQMGLFFRLFSPATNFPSLIL
jgi:hypothetical protein